LKDGLDDIEDSEQPVDKRLEIYKRMRQELLLEESKSKNDSQSKKMQELESKIKLLEKQKKEKED
jgi:hypothetical protein